MDDIKKDYTKISIQKKLHAIVKKVCDVKGVKMYHFEDEAIYQYLKTNYPEFLNGYSLKKE